MRKHLPDPDLFIGETIPNVPDYVIDKYIASGSNGHLFRAYNESIKNNLAFKIVPEENLSPNQIDEAHKANALENPAIVRYHHIVNYKFLDKDYVVFVCDYVEGKNLRDYMKQHRSNIEITFIEKFLQTIFGVLYELKKRGYHHGDIHVGNILVAKSIYSLSEKENFRVIDFSVRKLEEQAADENDYLSVANILRELLDCVEYTHCSGRDKYIFYRLQNDFLKRHLIETNSAADELAFNPEGMLNKLDTLENDWWREKEFPEANSKLETPFDYPNCEQIGNSHLLLKNLYSDRLLGLSEIQAKSNLMLTGPRGCGKTTVFRALSLDYLTSTKDEEDCSVDLEYIGIYYRCDDLYFSFPRYKSLQDPSTLDIPMHFLVVTLLATALEQIGVWAKKNFPDEFSKKEKILVTGLWDIFQLNSPSSPSFNELATLVSRLKGKERARAARKQRFAHLPNEQPIKGYFGPEILFKACCFIKKTFTFLDNRPFYFFIDDYSDPKITKDLQANLNRLVMHRSADVFFKLSTESPVSYAQYDIDGKRFVESREYDLVNLGLRYIKDDTSQPLEFLEDLFRRRFHAVEGYPVSTLKELLGSIPRNETRLARAYRDERDAVRNTAYAGYETIAAMCSGDIHYMIRLVARMVEDNGGMGSLVDSATPRIPPTKQNASIREAAGAFMESIRALPNTGPKLAEVITAFGKVAHSYLIYETSRDRKYVYPYQASRIEPHESLNLSKEAKKILDELLRYSVLIIDPRGKSRRGNVVPRFYMRRYLIPHFRLTFSKRDSIQLENTGIEELLCNPQKFEKRMMLVSEKNPNQLDLLNNEQ